ncbi:DMT family transporter [Marivivens donghaensis]|uniref:DMT family transporter n=1 Tax=Marivivens donghaensis TaxID=1699413 RepID=A0ABX0VU07_9RHOB|nr:DMT family transporter [Marivivens donghaensis]NIY71527.1 DMT family transporter [Marivivens donghaensis]
MQPLQAILFKLGAVAVFVTMQALIKSTSSHIPAGEAVFFRSFFALPIIIGWLAMRKELSTGFKTESVMNHFWRGIIGTTAMGLGFAALRYLPLPEVTAVGYATPIFIVIFAAMFLNEQVRLFRFASVAVGLIGVMVVMAPRLSVGEEGIATDHALGAMLALTSAVCAALAQVFIRKMTKTETTSSIVFWFSITATLLSLVTIYWGWSMPTPTEWLVLVTAGLLGGVGQILLTSSYRLGDASLVAPFDYASMIFSVGIGFFFFAEVPLPSTLAGAGIVIAAGIVIILRERQLGLERTKGRKAVSPGGK